MKFTKTLSWALLWCAVGIIGLSAFSGTYSGSIFAADSWQASLQDFERRVAEFQAYDGYPKIALVGPSYVIALGHVTSMHNLGFMGAYPQEIRSIILRYCSETDVILYPITLRDIAMIEKEPRFSLVSMPARRMVLMRESVRARLNLNLPDEAVTDDSLNRCIRPLYKQSEFPNLTNGGLINDLGNLECLAFPDSPAFDFLAAMQKENPRIKLIIFPTCPIGTTIPTYQDWMKQELSRRNVDYLDFSEIPSSYYTGLFHLTPDGYALIRERLIMSQLE